MVCGAAGYSSQDTQPPTQNSTALLLDFSHPCQRSMPSIGGEEYFLAIKTHRKFKISLVLPNRLTRTFDCQFPSFRKSLTFRKPNAFIPFCLLVSLHSPGCPDTHYIVLASLELTESCLPLPHKSCDQRHAPPHLAAVLILIYSSGLQENLLSGLLMLQSMKQTWSHMKASCLP